MNEALSDRRDLRPVLSHEIVWEGRVFNMARDRVDLGHSQVERDYVSHPGAVAVVALRYREDTGVPQVLLLSQYRHPVHATLWEIPAGLLDHDAESYLTAAQRELAEEADLQAQQWDVLLDYFTSPGGSDESLRVYLARQCSEIPVEERHFTREDEEAEMQIRWVDLDQAVEAVLTGRLHNPSACVGILALQAAIARDFSSLRDPQSPWLRAR